MARTIALLFGLIYIILGIIGFISGLGGTISMSPPSNLLSVFPNNLLLNIVRLIIGIAGLSMLRTEAAGAAFSKIFGIVLIIIGICGFFWPTSLGQSFLPLGGPNVWLHLVSGTILAIVGFASKPTTATA